MGFEKDKASSSSYVLNVPREDAPLVAPNGYHLSSQSKTFANVFIAIGGAGVLGLPYIFKRTGWAMGVLMLSSVAFLMYRYMMLLVHTRKRYNLTTNFGQGLLSSLCLVGLCINLFFTFPLMMNPVYEVVERRFCEAKYCLWIRWVTVLGVTVVALLVPDFADFFSLVGSGVCIVLDFVLPALFYLIVHKEELGWQGLALEVTIVVLGLALPFAEHGLP